MSELRPLLFFNCKDKFSTVLLTLVDSDYRFLAISVGSNGGNSDSGIFFRFCTGMGQCGTLSVPPPAELLSAAELGKINHVIVANKAFPM